MHCCALIFFSTLGSSHSSCCDVWSASTAVIILRSDTEYASNSAVLVCAVSMVSSNACVQRCHRVIHGIISLGNSLAGHQPVLPM